MTIIIGDIALGTFLGLRTNRRMRGMFQYPRRFAQSSHSIRVGKLLLRPARVMRRARSWSRRRQSLYLTSWIKPGLAATALPLVVGRYRWTYHEDGHQIGTIYLATA
jgi:hypothetical protein